MLTDARTVQTVEAGGADIGVIDIPLSVRILAAYVFTVPFGSSIPVPILPAPVDNLSSLLGAAAGAALLVMWVTQPTRRALPPAILNVWLLYLGWAALSNSWSVDSPDTVSGIFVLASLVLTAVAMLLVRYSEADLRLFEWSLVASGIVTGSIALVQLLTGNLTDTGIRVKRFALLGDDANITAAGLLLPAAASLMIATDRSASRRQRAVAWAGAAFSVFGVLLTVSRGGAVALGVVIVIVLYRRFGVRSAIAFVLVAALIVFTIAGPLARREGGTTGRSSIWTVAVLSCEEHCWIGSGYDTFPDVHEKLVLERPELGVLELRYEPHNMWLGTLVELGLVATLLLVVVAVAATYSLFVPTRFAMIASTGVVGVLAANVFVDNVGFKYFWLAIALATIAGTDRLPDSRRSVVR